MRLVRGAALVVAGALLGAGGVLLGQVVVARMMEEQVDSTFFLWRAIGYATFAFQGDEVQVALAVKELPEGALEHSTRVAWTLVAFGGILLAFTPFVRRRSKAKKKRRRA